MVGAEAQKSPMLTSSEVQVVTSEASPISLLIGKRDIGEGLHEVSVLSFSLTIRSSRMQAAIIMRIPRLTTQRRMIFCLRAI